MELIASAAFGLEGLVKRDLVRLGVQGIRPLPQGGVSFRGGLDAALAANLWLRCADRVLLVMGRFPACSFEELFQGVRRIPWEDILPPDAAAPIRAQCARSKLMSPSDCQSIAKKALAERMKKVYGYERMPETGHVHQVDVILHGDAATVALNTSGAALNRRGYRTWTGEAPLRETLAAAMLLACPWRIKQPLHDPCCGTGTLLIEAAFLALDRAPGLARPFDMEAWPKAPKSAMEEVRRQARLRFEAGLQRPLRISGSTSTRRPELAERHVRKAGLAGRIALVRRDVRPCAAPGRRGHRHSTFLRGAAGKKAARRWQPSWACSKAVPWLVPQRPHCGPGLEPAYGRRADRRRRLYNGRLECELLHHARRKGAMTPRAGVSVPAHIPGIDRKGVHRMIMRPSSTDAAPPNQLHPDPGAIKPRAG